MLKVLLQYLFFEKSDIMTQIITKNINKKIKTSGVCLCYSLIEIHTVCVFCSCATHFVVLKCKY